VFANSDIPALFAEVQDSDQEWVVAAFKLFLVADSSGLYSDLKLSVAVEKLVETELFSRVFLEDAPVLNDVHQTDFTLNYVAARA